MEDLGFVPVNEQIATEQPVKITFTPRFTAADKRYNFYVLTDALIIAPAKDRKFANKVIAVINNTTKVTHRKDLESKKRAMPTDIYDVDDFRLEIENKQDPENKHNYAQPRIVTVIDRKSGKIIERITKPFLVSRVTSALFKREDMLAKSQEALASAKETFKKITDAQQQNQK